ncbi:MAG: 30S ribosomal protein S13 [Candidatus Aenigmarchaeota archaeon]|nr:30S ribosomal protein S13 [Candidatus Aenigmarchaeota archaeon]
MGVKGKNPYKKKQATDHAPRKRKLIEGVTGIVRIAGVDVFGDKKVKVALLRVKGVGQNLSKSIIDAAGVDPSVMIGTLSEEHVAKLEEVIKNPLAFDIPEFMLNRRKDPFTGETSHVFGSADMTMQMRTDLDHLKKIRCYRGIRHENGLPCRGQKTRSSFRKGARMGVSKSRETRSKQKTAAKK